MGSSPFTPRGWSPPPRDPRDDRDPPRPRKPKPRPTGPAINPEAKRKADRGLEKLKAGLRKETAE